MTQSCRTCTHFIRGRVLRWAGVCRQFPKRADGQRLPVATGARRCYFLVSRWAPIVEASA